MMIRTTSNGRPIISPSAHISESATVMGNVIIEDDVFVAPNATIRADEPGSKVIIRSGCNVQDNVVVHALTGSNAEIRRGTSLSHACVVHGPCTIGEGCFIGFGSIVFRSVLGERCFVMLRAVVDGVTIPPSRLIGNGQIVDRQDDVFSLPKVTGDLEQFATKVAETNKGLAREGCRGLLRLESEDPTGRHGQR